MTDYEIAIFLLDSKNRYSQNKVNKNKDIVSQIEHKYSDSLSLRETIYRIIHNIEIRPVCKTCGNPVEFIGKTKIGFRTYCCPKCINNDVEIKERIKQTNEKLYGGLGFASKELYEKSEQTAIKLHGEEYRKTVQHINAKKTKKIRYDDENYNNRKQAVEHTDYAKCYSNYKKTMKLKYGVDNYYQSEECRKKCNNIESLCKAQETRIKNGTLRKSKIETKVYNFIKENYNLKIEENKRIYLDGLEIDIYIPVLKIGIEVQGDYFHKNPRFYTDPFEKANLPRTNKNLTVQDIWNKDLYKVNLAKEKGINLIQIWEYDINNNWEMIKTLLHELFKEFI